MSDILSEIISRLPILGATNIGGNSIYSGYIPILDANGQIPVAMVSGLSPIDLAASDISYDPTGVANLAGINDVQTAISTIANNFVKISNNLSDVNSSTGFNNLRQAGSTTNPGVFRLATTVDLNNGLDVPSTGILTINGTTVKLAIPPTVALSYFVPKSGTTMTGSLVLSGNPVTNLGAAPKQYVDTTVAAALASAGNITVPTQGVIWVSQGNTATDTRTANDQYNLTKPFATLTAAKNASIAGDTICVLPGIYNEKNLLKNNVNWYFYPGAGVTSTATSSIGIFDDNPTNTGVSNITCEIHGYGNFNNTSSNSGTGGVFNITQAGTSIICEAVLLTTGGNLSPVRISNGTLKIKVDTISGTSTGGLIQVASSGNITIEANTISGYGGFNLTGGTTRAYIRKNIATGNVSFLLDGNASCEAEIEDWVSTSSTSVLTSSSSYSGVSKFIINQLVSNAAVPIVLGSGYIRIDNAKIINNASPVSTNAVIQLEGNGSADRVKLILSNCDLVSSGTYCIIPNPANSAPVNVKLWGHNRSNVNKNTNVTLQYGTFSIITDGSLSYTL